MEKENRIVFGDVLIYSLLLVLSMKAVGILSVTWLAIYHFSIFVIAYLVIFFVIDVAVNIIEAVIKKRDE